MTPRDTALRQLLTGDLPLDRMGPRLRGAARRAVLSGDSERMGLVGRVILSELLRRGDLVRVPAAAGGAAGPNVCLEARSGRRIDVTPLSGGRAGVAAAEEQPREPAGLDRIVAVMDDAGRLDLPGPQAGETGGILAGILALLRRNLPQVRAYVMLHEETEIPEGVRGVFVADPLEAGTGWLSLRPGGGAVWIDNPSELPGHIRACDAEGGFERRERAAFAFASAAAVPLRAPADDTEADGPGPEVGLLFLVTRAGWTRPATIRFARRLSAFVTRRWRNQRDVNRRIHTDALTGVHNRRYFAEQFVHELERARRSGEALTLVMADIDYFKAVNDRHGHEVGDRALRAVAQGLQDELRRIDHVCRIGGEEFALILPDTSDAAAREVMRRLLDREFVIAGRAGEPPTQLRVTLSYGVVTSPDAGTDALELTSKADELVYLSKGAGRHQCHFWDKDGDHEQLLPGQASASD